MFFDRRRVRRRVQVFSVHSRARGNPDWVPAFAGTNGELSVAFEKRGRAERRAPRWRALKFTQFAQTRKPPTGPTDLDASQHRGMLKSGNKPQVRRCPASRARCLRFAPRRFLAVGRFKAFRHNLPRTGPSRPCASDKLQDLMWPSGPSARRRARRMLRGLDRRALQAHLRCKPFPGHRSPPPTSGDA